MSTKLYVGNLSFNTTKESLHAAFAAAGPVQDISMPTDRESGQPRGFAYVTMGSPQAATNAIAQLNGATLDGRQIKVEEPPSSQGHHEFPSQRGHTPPSRGGGGRDRF